MNKCLFDDDPIHPIDRHPESRVWHVAKNTKPENLNFKRAIQHLKFKKKKNSGTNQQR